MGRHILSLMISFLGVSINEILGDNLAIRCFVIDDMSFDDTQVKRCCLMDLLVMEAMVAVVAEVVYSGKGVHPFPHNIIDRLQPGTILLGYQVLGLPMRAK